MIRTLILGGALALALGAAAQADGFEPGREPGYGAPRLHRGIHHRHPHHVRRHLPRRPYGRDFVGAAEPGRLTDALALPVYNIPPRRFP